MLPESYLGPIPGCSCSKGIATLEVTEFCLFHPQPLVEKLSLRRGCSNKKIFSRLRRALPALREKNICTACSLDRGQLVPPPGGLPGPPSGGPGGPPGGGKRGGGWGGVNSVETMFAPKANFIGFLAFFDNTMGLCEFL